MQFIYQNSRLRWNTKLRQVITELHAAVCLAPRTHLHVDFSALQSKSHTSLAHQGIYRMLVKNLSQACRLSLLSLCFCRVTNLTWILTCVFFDIIPTFGVMTSIWSFEKLVLNCDKVSLQRGYLQFFYKLRKNPKLKLILSERGT